MCSWVDIRCSSIVLRLLSNSCIIVWILFFCALFACTRVRVRGSFIIKQAFYVTR